MRKMRKMKERIVSLALTFVMVMSLLVGMAPVEVRAEEGTDTIENVNIQIEKTGENTYQISGVENEGWKYAGLNEEVLGEYNFTISSFKEYYKEMVSSDEPIGLNSRILDVKNLDSYSITVGDDAIALIFGKAYEEMDNFYWCSEMAWFDLPANVGDKVTSSLGTTSPGGGNVNPPAGGTECDHDWEVLYDADDHYRKCVDCQQEADRAAHTFTNNVCSICGYEKKYTITIEYENFEGTENIDLRYMLYNTEADYVKTISLDGQTSFEIPVGCTFNTFIYNDIDYDYTVTLKSGEADIVYDGWDRGNGNPVYVTVSLDSDITIVLTKIVEGGGNENPPTTDTYNITLDTTNFNGSYLSGTAYDKNGGKIGKYLDDVNCIEVPADGKVTVQAMERFTVVAEGATVSELLQGGEVYYYEIKGFTKDTTIVVNKATNPLTIEESGDPVVLKANVNSDASIYVYVRGDNGARVYNWYKCDDINKSNPVLKQSGDRYDLYFDRSEAGLHYYYCDVTVGEYSIESDVIVVSVNERNGFQEFTITESGMGELLETLVEGQEIDSNVIEDVDVTTEISYKDTNGKPLELDMDFCDFAYREKGSSDWNFVWEASQPVIVDKDNYEYAILYSMYFDDYGFCDEGEAIDDSSISFVSEDVKLDKAWRTPWGDEFLAFVLKEDSGETPEVVVPSISAAPQDTSAQVGERATFSVTATGEGVTYQWQIDRNDGNGFVNLNGATNASYTTSVVDMDCNGFKYQCIITNAGGSVTTTPVVLTVTERPIVHTHVLTLVSAKAATCTAPGNIAYYTCSGCDVLFADADQNTTTTAEAVKIAKLAHDWSGEWTVTKEATTTETGKKETLCVNGCGQKKVVVIPTIGTIEEDSNIEKDAEVAPDVAIDEATLDNTKEELLNAGSIFNETEKQLIEDGADARVWLEITKTENTDMSSAEKAKMEEKAAEIMGDDVKITYFEADLFKQVGTTVTEISEPGIKIKVTITIPAELLNTDVTVTREYKILRLHDDGQLDVLSGTFNAETGEFSFETDKFSTYAIVYADAPANEENNSSSLIPYIASGLKDVVPKTGESNASAFFLALMVLSGFGVVLCTPKKKRY